MSILHIYTTVTIDTPIKLRNNANNFRVEAHPGEKKEGEAGLSQGSETTFSRTEALISFLLPDNGL